MPMNVSHVMRRSFATIKPEASLLDAAHLLLETNQRGLPVIDSEGSLVGLISEGDFLHRVDLDIAPPPGNWLEEILGIEEETPVRRRMRASLVREAMNPNERAAAVRFSRHWRLSILFPLRFRHAATEHARHPVPAPGKTIRTASRMRTQGETQPLRVMAHDDLQAVARFQVFEQLSDDAVSEARFDLRDVDDPFRVFDFGHAVTDCCNGRLSSPISVGP
jgi:CBS domain-containing protein